MLYCTYILTQSNIPNYINIKPTCVQIYVSNNIHENLNKTQSNLSNIKIILMSSNKPLTTMLHVHIDEKLRTLLKIL